jgi:hypothetical protein
MFARFLIALLGLSLVGLLVAALEGRAAWVYAATGAFMVIGVTLALHTALRRSGPGSRLQAAGYGPTRQARTWRAIVDGVPIEAVLHDAHLQLRAAGVPQSLSIEAGTHGQPTGDPTFDGAARCVGRSAEVAALGTALRTDLLPLLEIGVRVHAGVVLLPADASVDVIGLTSRAAAALSQTLRDVRAALLHRVQTEPPAVHLLAVGALAAGWPQDPRTRRAAEALLDDADPHVRQKGAEMLDTMLRIRPA